MPKCIYHCNGSVDSTFSLPLLPSSETECVHEWNGQLDSHAPHNLSPPCFNVVAVKVAVGYIIEQHVMRELLADIEALWITDDEELSDSDSEGGEVVTVNPVIRMVNIWARLLTDEQRARTPRILYYLLDVNAGYDPYDFFFLTRWAYVKTVEEVNQKLSECESDWDARQRFMEVFGRGIQESHMKFATRVYRTLDDIGV